MTMRPVSTAQRGTLRGRAPKIWRGALCAALGVAMAGCASTPPERSWLSLPLEMSPVSTGASGSASPRSSPQLRLLRVQVPEYLQSNRVRFRDSAATLAEWPGVRWAERVEIGLTRHLAAQLNRVAGAGSVCEDACNAPPSVGTLQVNFIALDHDRPHARLYAHVSWALTPAAGSAGALRQGQLSLTQAVEEDSAAGQAAAMARVNALIARDIAQQLRR